MSDWWAAAPALAAGVLVIYAPGLALGAALALRGFALVAAAPALTFGAAGLLAIAAGLVGVPWTPLTAAAGVALLALALWALRRALRLGALRTEADGPRWVLLLGLGVAAVATVATLTAYIGAPDAISQTNDAIFHLNAVRWAVDTGDASSLLINAVQGSRGFYPAAWHAAVSLVVQLGVDLPVAVNAVVIALSALAWPTGVAWLMLVTTRSRLTAGLAGAMSAAFATFPLLMLQWGVLYPNHLSIALLPAAIAAAVSVGSGTAGVAGAVRAVGLACLAAAGVALAQPATILPLALCAWLVWAGRGLTAWRTAQTKARVRGILLLAVGGVAVAGLWLVVGAIPSDGHWREFTGIRDAAWHVLSLAHLGAPPRIALAVLVAVGVVAALLRAPLRWLAALWAVLAALYVTVAAISLDVVRNTLVGAWYEDPYRIAALTTLASAPLAAVGLEALVRLVLGRRLRERLLAPIAATAAVVVVVLTVVLTPTVFRDVVFDVGGERPHPYREAEADYLEDDERALLETLPDLVAEDATIIGNPGTGMGFGFALTGLDVQPRSWRPPRSFLDVLGRRLPEAAADPAVCEIVDEVGADYVLDFGPGFSEPGRWVLPGFTGFEGREGFELVAGDGDVALWRITACD
ncbi:DUF6541 family protein [Microbacterium sp. JZ31]|uniref:DUF6541 family protein n=1 Tax=Microbacterium sp. JZ31 TaxID=1906274 RepID=UPI001934214A|nr:DUF6541 family protein [Microbacterium sp. JZ31]